VGALVCPRVAAPRECLAAEVTSSPSPPDNPLLQSPERAQGPISLPAGGSRQPASGAVGMGAQSAEEESRGLKYSASSSMETRPACHQRGFQVMRNDLNEQTALLMIMSPSWGYSNVNLQKICQFLTTISHKMAPRTRKRLQKRGRDAPTEGLLWLVKSEVFDLKPFHHSTPRRKSTPYKNARCIRKEQGATRHVRHAPRRKALPAAPRPEKGQPPSPPAFPAVPRISSARF
jgi:hypothetical protein